jgi:hypothetical protein
MPRGNSTIAIGLPVRPLAVQTTEGVRTSTSTRPEATMAVLRQLEHPIVDAALATAATLLGMEVVMIGSLDETTYRVERLHGELPGLEEGGVSDRADSFCHRMLSGAPATTANADGDEFYASASICTSLPLTSYVGVPIRDADGAVVGTLCGLDRRRIEVPESSIAVLRDLAELIGRHVSSQLHGQVIRRTPEGWQVGTEATDGVLSAMVLADLIAPELEPPTRPPRANDDVDELGRLRGTVAQLEHALAARVVVEQAIGVLTERLGYPPRECFERLRRVARGNGQRVHELARAVVASACDDSILLPDELEMPTAD